MQKYFFSILISMLCCQLEAQVYNMNRHNTNYNAAWISCAEAQNPNSARGSGHWISYDLRDNYDVFQLSFWNLNDPARLGEGIRDVVIDISANGSDWVEAGTYTIPQSEGSGYYMGTEGINLNGITARYVLITALSNYGGECYGLSEVKIAVQEAVLPVTLIDFYADCNDDGSVSLTWQVESEYNNESYTCQSSDDGKVWVPFEIIPGENIKRKNVYSVTDNDYWGGRRYYRILQKDFDGSETYFPVIYADCELENDKLTIHPNPTPSIVTVRFNTTTYSDKNYQIKDIGGKVLISGTLSGNDTDIDFSHLTSGTYFITISDDRRTFQRKIIKI